MDPHDGLLSQFRDSMTHFRFPIGSFCLGCQCCQNMKQWSFFEKKKNTERVVFITAIRPKRCFCTFIKKKEGRKSSLPPPPGGPSKSFSKMGINVGQQKYERSSRFRESFYKIRRSFFVVGFSFFFFFLENKVAYFLAGNFFWPFKKIEY